MKSVMIQISGFQSYLAIVGFVVLAVMYLSGTGLAWAQDYDGRENMKPPSRWGYYVVESFTGDSQRKYLETVVRSLSVLSITGFKLGKDGHLHISHATSQKEIVALAKRSGTELFPLVTFTSSADGHTLLSSAASRKRAVTELAALTRSADHAGLHLDLEYLPSEDAQKLADFLHELRSTLGGKKLTMAIFPPVDFPEKWSRFHDLKLIGPLLDEVVVMCYDYHRPGTPAGPVTDLRWAERNVAQVLKDFRPDQVWLGIPAYGYDWSKDRKTKVLSAREGVKLAVRHKAVRHASGTLHFQYNAGGESHEVYLADLETRKRMECLAGVYGLKGIALWRIGFEER